MPPENPPRFNYAEPVSITTAGELETIFRAYRGNTGYLQKLENNHSGTNEEARSANWFRRASHGGGSVDAPAPGPDACRPVGRRDAPGPARRDGPRGHPGGLVGSRHPGRLAQRERVSLTRRRSQVQILYRPPSAVSAEVQGFSSRPAEPRWIKAAGVELQSLSTRREPT